MRLGSLVNSNEGLFSPMTCMQQCKAPPPPPVPHGGTTTTTTDPRCLHTQLIKTPTTNLSLFNNLIHLYSQSPSTLPSALHLFLQLPHPNLVTWTTIISAYARSQTPHFSLRLFLSMTRRHHCLPNARTFAALFKSCASLSSLRTGLQLHCFSLKLPSLSNPIAATALVDMYLKCNRCNDALQVFDKIPQRDEVCWGGVICGLSRNGRSAESLVLFSAMHALGVASTMYAVSGVLRAVAESAALEKGRILHGHAIVTGLKPEIFVASAIVDMYGKSGIIVDARRLFDEIENPNIVSFNSIMAGYAQQGDFTAVLQVFDEMPKRGLVPDELSFLAILSTCSNAGLFNEAETWLVSMEKDFGVAPGIEHYTCVAGSLGRVGRLQEAERLVLSMPFEADSAVWRMLLSACTVHGVTEMGQRVGERLLEVERNDDTSYVMLSNIYAAAGSWEGMAKVRKMMKERRVKRVGGKSWIEVKGEVHVFMAGDRNHPRAAEIYVKLMELISEIEKLGYRPAMELVLREVEKKEKQEELWFHSEKLAVAFGVVSGVVPPGKALRVVKNLRICRDCHSAFKLMSRVIDRNIVVRDVSRYHRFEHGNCTCRDSW